MKHSFRPIVVWVHCDAAPDSCEWMVAPHGNDALWISIFLNGHSAATPHREELFDEATMFELHARICEVVELLGKAQRISPIRVYLAGTGLGAVIALQLFLAQPTDFRGIALFDSDHTALQRVAVGTRIEQQPALVVTSTDRSPPNFREVLSLGRLLHSTGMRITTGLYVSPRGDAPRPERMYQDLRSWIQNDRV